MLNTTIDQTHIEDFQNISYFLNENNIPMSVVSEITFNNTCFAVTTETLYKNFNVKLNNMPYTYINWCDIDYLNNYLKNNNQNKIIQILDIIHHPNHESKTVYYITSNKN